MADLSVKYLGLDLKSPVVASSSGLTSTIERIREMEEAGIGAVVLKSLFEEQILFEGSQYHDESVYPEAEDYLRNYIRDHSVGDYLDLIEKVKKETSVPVIASVNCVSVSEWIDFAKKMEDAGADAIELNVYFLPVSAGKSSPEYEQVYLDLAEKLKGIVHIPVAFKLGRQFTNLNYLVSQLAYRHVDGVVLFNRFYEPDIDIKNLRMVSAGVFSKLEEIRQTLRWIGILSGQSDRIDLAASTGIHDAGAVVKLLLAGADVTMVCSVLYEKGISYIKTLNEGLTSWMDEKGFGKIDEFRGKLNYKNIGDPVSYERSQFMKYFSDYH